MTENDRIFKLFGMRLLEGEEGRARVAATVGEECLNAHDVGHGALIFALADVAFSVAVNSVTDALGIQWSFNILRAARRGDELIGDSRIIHRGRRVLVCDLSVKNQDGELVALGQATALPVDTERLRK